MTGTGSAPLIAPQPRLFEPLQHAAFARLQHASCLKGLLKPFKGKGELESWASQCEALRDQLISLARRLVAQASAPPFDLLTVVLAQSPTAAGTAYLRWRNIHSRATGVSQWTQLIDDSRTPLPLVHELFALERERVVLNMQISLTHTLARQARECAGKLAQAEAAYQRRVARHASTTRKESVP